MNKLNESASWVSDVSDTRSESETKLPDQRDEEEEEAKHAKIQLAEGECLRLGEMLNQSVTWIDVDLSDSEDEEEKKRKEQQQAEEELAQRRLLVDSCGYRQGVARSFSY
mmetsp:Transcript_38350/g.81290  ORF Transcript_38350/g.81290 Transcript_38350/m.81290 type:complete len:110 (-) Transcript_38350:56-385(-)